MNKKNTEASGSCKENPDLEIRTTATKQILSESWIGRKVKGQ
jgi:hypothetical protein